MYDLDLGRTARRAVVCLLAALTVLALAESGRSEPQALARTHRYASDQTGLLPPERIAALNEKLAAFDRESGCQIAVYVGKRLPAGTTLEELANRTYRAWGLGSKEKDTGVLFLLFTEDRAMRVEVGYGLEATLPDVTVKRITSDVVKPRLRDGDLAGGVEAGADALVAAIRGGRAPAPAAALPAPPPAATPAPAAIPMTRLAFSLFLSGVLFLLTAIAVWNTTVQGRWLARVVWGVVWTVVSGVAIPGAIAAAVVLAGLLALVLLARAASRRMAGFAPGASAASSSADAGWVAASSFDSGSSSSGSSSDSGPSELVGGGGDSGGGGASDTW